MQRSYLVRNGRLERDRGIDRGEMLVWTEEQWRSRFEEQYNRIMKRVIIFLVLTCMVTILAFVWMALLVANEHTFSMFVVIIFLIIFTYGLTVPIMMYQSKRSIAMAPTVGLYERGLQLTSFYFIPYIEMARTERGVIGWPTKLEAIIIHPRFDNRNWFDRMSFRWAILISFLGIEGAHKLEGMVLGDLGRRMPPELVVYE